MKKIIIISKLKIKIKILKLNADLLIHAPETIHFSSEDEERRKVVSSVSG